MIKHINLNGTYYEFNCMNSFVDGSLIKASEFKSDREAIRLGADYEAYVNKVVFKDNVIKSRKQIYDPMSCFD